MPADVETMMYAGEVPWHGLGQKVTGSLSSAEAMKAAGLDWTVATELMYLANGQQVPKARAVKRSTDGAILGVVGPDWTPLQNPEAFNWFDPIVRAGEAHYETAGALRSGGRVWILARVNRPDAVIVPQSDDRVSQFVLLSNGHDGSLAVRVGFTNVRVVCQNTLSAAHTSAASKLIRMRHTKGILGALDKVREVMDLAAAEFTATAEQYRALAKRQINVGDLEKYVKRVFVPRQADEPAAGASDGDSKKGARTVEKITQLFEEGTGANMAGVKGTWWAAYNAVTDYIPHGRGADAAVRLASPG